MKRISILMSIICGSLFITCSSDDNATSPPNATSCNVNHPSWLMGRWVDTSWVTQGWGYEFLADEFISFAGGIETNHVQGCQLTSVQCNTAMIGNLNGNVYELEEKGCGYNYKWRFTLIDSSTIMEDVYWADTNFYLLQ